MNGGYVGDHVAVSRALGNIHYDGGKKNRGHHVDVSLLLRHGHVPNLLSSYHMAAGAEASAWPLGS